MKRTWWKEAAVYQVYPRSFMDSNGDGIGDIRGIIQKLDYLRYLGIDVIWLSPVYQSPNDDNGYDISDYQAIMKEFGTMEDFYELLEEAHRRGLKVIMDLVVNHTSDEHAWFAASRKDRDNPYRDYYFWRQGKEDGSEPNNWGSVFSGSAWQYDEQTQMYYLHMFSKKQPDLNWDNEAVRTTVFDMMAWWCEKGIDGFRMDVISMISKVPGLPDGEKSDGLYGDATPYVVHGPNVHRYLREMNERVLSRYDIMTVGETAGVTTEEAQKYAGEDAGELNMVFQFEHVDLDAVYGKWGYRKPELRLLRDTLTKWQTKLSDKAWNSLYLENHDQPRSVSRFGDDRSEYRELSAKMLASCIYFMQGTPYIYQGQELGMTNYPFTNLSEFRDIESINAYHEMVDGGALSSEEMMKCLCYKSRDNARTPMQWDDTKNAGFTIGNPWIAVNPNYKEINAAAQMNDSHSIYQYYRKLLQIRKQYKVFVYGSYELLLPDSDSIFCYRRTLGSEKVLVLCNFTSAQQSVTMSHEFADAECLLSNYEGESCTESGILKPYEAVVLYQSEGGNQSEA